MATSDQQKELKKLFAEQWETVYDADGKAICGQQTSKGRIEGTNAICQSPAGLGTPHLGVGPCRHHGGLDVSPLDGFMQPSKSLDYSLDVTNEHLARIINEEANRQDVDNIDGEIILVRSLIRFLLRYFGLQVELTSDGNLNPTDTEAYLALNSQTKEAIRLIQQLSSLIRRKYEILATTNSVIPRDVVDAYINNIRIVLMNTLRDSCPRCHEHTGQRTAAFAGLSMIGSI